MTTISSLKQQRRPRSDSIGPATTPDINPPLLPPFESSQFNSALARNVSISASRRGKERMIIDSDEDEDEDDDQEEDEVKGKGDWEMMYIGWSMLSFSFLAFTFGIWSIAVGPFLDSTGIIILDTMAQDTHYKYLLVFIVPVTLYAVIINWWGLKIFRHA